MIGHLVGVGVVTGAPEPRPGAGVAAVVDVDGRYRDSVARHGLEVAHHVAHARVAGDVDALALRISELGRDCPRETETERGHVAPAEVAPRDLRLIDRAGLVARAAGIAGEK